MMHSKELDKGLDKKMMEIGRQDGPVLPEKDRIKNFDEFHGSLPEKDRLAQAGRCMNCGIPFCQFGGMIAGMASGCPLHNLVPEVNALVSGGSWQEAYKRLSMTHSFPEFTGRVCPALCEKACTCGLHSQPVSTKENELAVIEHAYAHDYVEEPEPSVRTGKKVAVIGSGPSGLAAAQLLNRRGHQVDVYERSSRPGGLLRYGIPNMKIEKTVIDRRIQLMEQAGVQFICGKNAGKDLPASWLTENYDALVLACGASRPRDIAAEGRDAEGIFFAVDYLSRVTRYLEENDYLEYPRDLAAGKDVVVIGGGDTGNDCLATSIRLGAASVTQLEMMPRPSEERLDGNPWPEWPRVLKTDYGQEEAIEVFGRDPRLYQTTVKEFLKDEEGKLSGLILVSLQSVEDPDTGRRQMVPVEGSERTIPAQLVLIAAGFLGSEDYVREAFGVESNQRTNVATRPDHYQTSVPGIFTAGDMHRGQSLVVWAIAEGRAAAAEVDEYLMGYTNL